MFFGTQFKIVKHLPYTVGLKTIKTSFFTIVHKWILNRNLYTIRIRDVLGVISDRVDCTTVNRNDKQISDANTEYLLAILRINIWFQWFCIVISTYEMCRLFYVRFTSKIFLTVEIVRQEFCYDLNGVQTTKWKMFAKSIQLEYLLQINFRTVLKLLNTTSVNGQYACLSRKINNLPFFHCSRPMRSDLKCRVNNNRVLYLNAVAFTNA